MNFDGLDFGVKPKIRQLLAAIEARDLTALYASLRNADEAVRKNLVSFLLRNPVKGWEKAISILAEAVDSMAAVRAASVWLMLNNMESK